VDDLARRSAKLAEYWSKIREVSVAHQTAMAQEAQARQYNDSNDYEHNEQNGVGEELKGQGGFAGGDSKKRRGV
jgi:hypothetical protein